MIHRPPIVPVTEMLQRQSSGQPPYARTNHMPSTRKVVTQSARKPSNQTPSAAFQLNAQPVQHGRGRPRLPLSDMVFASVYKVYVGFSSRRFTSDLREAYTAGLIDSRPHSNSVNNYLSKPGLTDKLRELITASSLPLKAMETDFAVDSSGFSTCRYVRWFNKKYGRETDNREWVKVHLMCGVNTKVVTAVDISGWAANDTNYFVPLLERTAQHVEIREVSADKACLSKKNLNAVELVGGRPSSRSSPTP